MLSAPGFFNDGSDEAPKLHVYLDLDTIADLLLRAGTALWRHGSMEVKIPGTSSGALIKTAHATEHLFNCRSGFIPRFEMPSRHKAAPTTIPIQAEAVRLRSRPPTSFGVSDPPRMKLAFMEPIFARIAFLHGRIASSGSMQAPVDENLCARPAMACGLVDYLVDFGKMWTRSMLGFLRATGPGDVLIFSPEILSGAHYYARLVPDSGGRLTEESDRYAQALLCRDLARQCFDGARCRLATIPAPKEPTPSTSG